MKKLKLDVENLAVESFEAKHCQRQVSRDRAWSQCTFSHLHGSPFH
jgi:hypothetical protein